MTKRRVTVTLDAALVDAAKASVVDGRSESVSAYVGEALEARIENDARLAALTEAITRYEADAGMIDDAEIADLDRRDRDAMANARSRQRKAG